MDDNIIKFGDIQGGKQANEDEFPKNYYVIIDIDDQEYYAEGYLLFTSQHVCIMKTTNKGPVAALMLPLHRVKVSETLTEEEYYGTAVN